VTVRLRLMDKADKEIMKMPRAVKGAIYEFMHKFRQDPFTPGLRLKPLKGDSRLYSARVGDDYRALLLRVAEGEFLLVAVKPRGGAYDNLDRYAYQINQVTGGIEFIDISSIAQTASTKPGLFARFPESVLLDLGVAKPLLPLLARITSEQELREFAECAPQLTADILFALHDGATPDEVLDQVTAPVKAPDPVDVTDYETAVTRPATLVSTDDEALAAVLEDDFARWQVFLHPVQRMVVNRSYSGPARVSGGPGTGKTIVALHRVKWLVKRLPPGDGKDVLLTTFNKNLAADLRNRLLQLGGRELADRVDVVNIDALARQVITEATSGARLSQMDDSRAVDLWREPLLEISDVRWEPEFLYDEWSQVILGHAIESRQDYFRARRAGRGSQLNRAQRAEIWQLVEQYTKRLEERNLWTFGRIAARAARIEQEHDVPRYRHIVVDEAQDLSAAHWMLLRAMVAKGPDDLFITGDTHQRIYANYVTLGSLGIEIRGRSTRLTLTYRSTHQILTLGERILGGEDWDDLDGGTDSLSGYRSVLRGPDPVLREEASWHDELDSIVRQVKEWGTASVAISVPERRQVEDVEKRLLADGIPATAIGPDGPRKPDAIHVGTLHRFKGLEYQRMILAGITDRAIPGQKADTGDPTRQRRELMRARSLLFVAATRARDALVISWHGQPSRFLPPVSLSTQRFAARPP
jgi:superfamily I DNA/RNA helicase/mRNA-degrading endonuclease RelE of RelBE toxin-antitoxin system